MRLAQQVANRRVVPLEVSNAFVEACRRLPYYRALYTGPYMGPYYKAIYASAKHAQGLTNYSEG